MSELLTPNCFGKASTNLSLVSLFRGFSDLNSVSIIESRGDFTVNHLIGCPKDLDVAIKHSLQRAKKYAGTSVIRS